MVTASAIPPAAFGLAEPDALAQAAIAAAVMGAIALGILSTDDLARIVECNDAAIRAGEWPEQAARLTRMFEGMARIIGKQLALEGMADGR